ncbi:pyrroline-5-carboxylate reductase (plasmid) [Rhizobium grahamii]|uniref:Pyrroline-5-carboxylate reductase n=1 Tax=Rhizobium grahamii TaxID=1120045 RepID=A0A5Q0CC37_9HYPH|nr:MULTISPECIES: pyrroline-5-carboxylate reductase [Rhizobium]QFY62983.1 pyrroline-5-carboxylate reductase [Rhizobium grahamii]QRM52261.1 pyrroline-5-carboxylate reductase [Rhizobium sp. BG6]
MVEKSIGFVGTGAISEAMVRGLLREPPAVQEVHVSPRNSEIAARLAAEFSAVQIAPDNQAVVDRSEVVVLAIRPQIAEEVIRQLRFRAGQAVIGVVAATRRDSLLEWIDADVHLVQAIPLPFVADRQGVTAIFPPDQAVAALFNVLGSAVECESRKEYDLLAAATALMSTYFGVMDMAATWLEANGLDANKAGAFLAPLFESLAQRANVPGVHDFTELSNEFATKGGLNEQVLVDFENAGARTGLHRALDRVFARIEGRDS